MKFAGIHHSKTASGSGQSDRTDRLRVGLTFNCRRVENSVEKQVDCQAEYDRPSTIAAIREALDALGYEVIELEADASLPAKISSTPVDVVFNIAEGMRGRSRESQVPALLEFMGIAYSGSDPVALSVCHDKALAKKVVSQAGIPTAKFLTLRTGQEPLPANICFPLMVKPSAEGSSKGIHLSSVVENEADLRTRAQTYIAKYQQPVLVEEFLPGREFTVGMLGEFTPRVLPIMEVVFTNKEHKFPVYSFLSKLDATDVRLEVPAKITEALAQDLTRTACAAFAALGCRDVSRMDFRLNAKGEVYFIECNPLPGIVPNFSDLSEMAIAAGMSYQELVAEILAPALRRREEATRISAPVQFVSGESCL